MKKLLALVSLATMCLAGLNAEAAAPKRDNYVVFYIQGDCHQEDCIALVKEMMQPIQHTIVYMDASPLAPHQTTEYKTVTITFKTLVNAPYSQVMQKMAELGYHIVSYVIHDTHGNKDVIVPH